MKKETKEIDFELIKATLSGDKVALNQLIGKHYSFTFNVCLKMLYSHQDAEDVNQEIWIKIITRLKKFHFESAFTTWLYRIAVNHILDLKKKSIENEITKGFDGYAENLASIKNQELNGEEKIILKDAIEEAKFSCMSGMLMCLDREQRLIYVMGDIFKIDHKVGSEIFDVSIDNYRQKLSRARKDLFNFMNNNCSLVNKNNPCTCSKKTKGFIKLGYVNPESLKFNNNFKETIFDNLVEKSDKLDDINAEYHTRLFQKLPFEEKPTTILDEILNEEKLKSLLNLN
nr:RNA polymerase sigma factor [uncultured Draconibacterium sp.]